MIRWAVIYFLLFSVLNSQDKQKIKIEEYSLEKCLLIALKNNSAIKKFKIDKKITKMEHQVSNAIFEWNLNSTSVYTDDPDKYSQTLSTTKSFQTGTNIVLSGNLSETSGLITDDKDSVVSFSITQKLLAGSSKKENSFPIYRTRLKDEQARNQLDVSIRDVLFSVTRNFYQYIKSVETIKINENALKQAKKFLSRVVDFKDAGRGTILDVATAEVQVASREESILRSKTIIQNSLDQLRRSMGLDIDKEINISKKISLGVTMPKMNYEFSLKHAMRYRPDYKNSLISMELIQRELEISSKGKKPNLSVTYALSVNETGSSYDSISKFSDRPEHSLTFNFSMPLFRKRKMANYEIKKFILAKEKIKLWDKQQDIKLEVKKVLRLIDEKIKQIEVQEKKVKIETKRVESFEIRLKNGLIDSLEVTRAYDDLDSARTDLINSKLNLKILIAEYHKVIGSEPTFIIKSGKQKK